MRKHDPFLQVAACPDDQFELICEIRSKLRTYLLKGQKKPTKADAINPPEISTAERIDLYCLLYVC